MMKKLAAALTLGLSLLAAPAFADTLTITDATTLADPTYNRVLSGGAGLSAVGTAVHYQVTEFSVSQAGSYSFLLTGDSPVNWDTFLTLYTTFNAGAALDNDVASNDDFPTIGISGFSANLLAGTSYFAVVTGFDNEDVGAYTLKISGDGRVTEGAPGGVPEPSAWALMILGFGATGTLLRRRQVAVAA